jgi:hypothetical protein
MGPEKDIRNPVLRNHFPRRFVRGLFIVLTTFALLFFLAVSFFLDKYVKKKIIQSVERSSKGLYHAEIGSLDAKFWSGAVHMTGIRLYQDQAVLERLQKSDTAEHLSRINVEFEAIDISSIKWRNYIKSNNLQVGKIDLHEPSFHMLSESLHENTTDSDKNFLDLLPGLIASFAGSLKIRELNVISGELHFDLKYETGITHQTSDHINISLNEIEIDTISKQKTIYSEDATLSFSNYLLVTPHKNFSLKINNGFGNVSDSVLILHELHFKKQKDTLGKEDMMDIHIREIRSSGLSFQSLLKKNKMLDLRKLEFNSPDIHIKTPYIPNKTRKPVNGLPDIVPAFAKDFIDSLIIDTLLVTDGKIKTDIENENGHIIQDAEKIKIEFIRLKSEESSTQKITTARVILSLQKYELNVTSLNFKMRMGSINLSTRSKELLMENIYMTQIHSHGPAQRHYFTNHIKHVIASGINFSALVEDKRVMMDHLKLNNMDLKVYTDGSKPSKQKEHSMPQDFMAKVRFPLDINEVAFDKASILYASKEPGFKQTELTFTRSSMLMKNVSNDPKKMTAKTPSMITGSTLVMGQGQINFNLRVPFLSKNFDCSYDGTVGRMNGSLFNDFMRSSGLQVEQGQIEPSHFHVNVVNGNASADMEFIYHDLKVRVIDTANGELKSKKSLLANFAIKNDNPQKKGHQPERVHFETSITHDDAFFYFLWKVLRIGAVETMTKSKVYKQKK